MEGQQSVAINVAGQHKLHQSPRRVAFSKEDWKGAERVKDVAPVQRYEAQRDSVWTDHLGRDVRWHQPHSVCRQLRATYLPKGLIHRFADDTEGAAEGVPGLVHYIGLHKHISGSGPPQYRLREAMNRH
jgi:hypothetical protein